MGSVHFEIPLTLIRWIDGEGWSMIIVTEVNDVFETVSWFFLLEWFLFAELKGCHQESDDNFMRSRSCGWIILPHCIDRFLTTIHQNPYYTLLFYLFKILDRRFVKAFRFLAWISESPRKMIMGSSLQRGKCLINFVPNLKTYQNPKACSLSRRRLTIVFRNS